MKKITYLLGAGASYHAIPVVDAMNSRMKLFLEMCDETIPIAFGLESPIKMDSPKIDEELYKHIDLKNILDKYKAIIYEAIKHKTIDTYAKKLFIRSEGPNLFLLKEFLCLYFAFEQSNNINKVVKGKPFEKLQKEIKDSILNDFNTHLDYRYDVFFATLLDKNTKELPQNIKIISWNYDHQIELAYSDFTGCNIEEAKEFLKVFPRKEEVDGNIIKLNGSANQAIYITDSRSASFHTFEFHKSKNDFLYDTLHNNSSVNHTIKEYALNFAWEEKEHQKKSIELASSIIKNTDELIIIGYSFPYFNRKIDYKILKVFMGRSIRIQCLEKDFNGIKQNICDIFGEDLGSKIQYHDDLSQFYIPSSQFFD